jgi:hypothetical protein
MDYLEILHVATCQDWRYDGVVLGTDLEFHELVMEQGHTSLVQVAGATTQTYFIAMPKQ